MLWPVMNAPYLWLRTTCAVTVQSAVTADLISSHAVTRVQSYSVNFSSFLPKRVDAQRGFWVSDLKSRWSFQLKTRSNSFPGSPRHPYPGATDRKGRDLGNEVGTRSDVTVTRKIADLPRPALGDLDPLMQDQGRHFVNTIWSPCSPVASVAWVAR